jgi:uncharacterized membrane protein
MREPRRFRNGAFWGLMAASMWGGDRFGDFGNGLLVLALVGIGALGLGRSDAGDVAPDTRAERAARHGNRLFLIALVIPLTALAGTLLFKQLPTLVDSKQATLISLALGVLLALAAGGALLRASCAVLASGPAADGPGGLGRDPAADAGQPGRRVRAGRRGRGGGRIVRLGIPAGSLFGAVVAFGVGMALFTMVMGNAFAAFPVMFAAIGMPLLITTYHGDPAVISAIGMLAGFAAR